MPSGIVEDVEALVDFDGDPVRNHFVAETDLRHEIMGLEEQAMDLIAAREAGQDIPDFDFRLSSLNQSLMSARAELSDLQFNRPGN